MIARAITVYCSSSRKLDGVYYQAGRELGQAIARKQWHLVYGGNPIGLMGEVAAAARSAGGRVTGITPQQMMDEGIGDQNADELIVTPDMASRKLLLQQRGDAFIAAPGGLGTFEEIFETISSRSLGSHDKPIVILNLCNYYQPMLAMLEQAVEQGFIRQRARRLWQVANSVDDAVACIAHQFNNEHSDRPAIIS